MLSDDDDEKRKTGLYYKQVAVLRKGEFLNFRANQIHFVPERYIPTMQGFFNPYVG